MADETYDLIPTPEENLGELSPSALTDEPTGPIDHDLPCRHCGYNLRGLTTDRACPECGTAVGRSLLGDQLRFSDPAWVRTLAKGMTWLLCGVLLGLIVGVSTIIIGIIYQSVNPHALTLPPVIPGLISLVGYWLVTTPEPSVEVMSGVTVRSLVRWTMTCSIGINLADLTMVAAEPLLSVAIDLIGGVLGMVGYFTLFVYARRLALRVPDYRLAHQTRVVMWGIVTTLGVMILFGVLTTSVTILGSGRSSGGFIVIAIPICMVFIAYLVFAIWSLVLLFWYRRAATSSALAAEITWAHGLGLGEVFKGERNPSR